VHENQGGAAPGMLKVDSQAIDLDGFGLETRQITFRPVLFSRRRTTFHRAAEFYSDRYRLCRFCKQGSESSPGFFYFGPLERFNLLGSRDLRNLTYSFQKT